MEKRNLAVSQRHFVVEVESELSAWRLKTGWYILLWDGTSMVKSQMLVVKGGQTSNLINGTLLGGVDDGGRGGRVGGYVYRDMFTVNRHVATNKPRFPFHSSIATSLPPCLR